VHGVLAVVFFQVPAQAEQDVDGIYLISCPGMHRQSEIDVLALFNVTELPWQAVQFFAFPVTSLYVLLIHSVQLPIVALP